MTKKGLLLRSTRRTAAAYAVKKRKAQFVIFTFSFTGVTTAGGICKNHAAAATKNTGANNAPGALALLFV